MKKNLSLLIIALFSAVITLGGYKIFVEQKPVPTHSSSANASLIPTSYNTPNFIEGTNIDFTLAAEKTVNAVVHIKNRTTATTPTSIFEFIYGSGQQREIVGSGSGVIISPDGYIVTNNHVIDNATEIEVILNNNQHFDAELVGTDPKTDIALLKIKSAEALPFVPFADSNALKVGEWVLAVGNPFNLTSTVTAGIVSAKARNLSEFDGNPQSFIQTDAAVNRGNSGGALVNTNGELVGINTAISSQTGAFIGYSFAVPSNITRKIVEDILEYGNVQRAILGIQVLNSNSNQAKELNVDNIQGVYIADVEQGSGADLGGLEKGDVIKKIDAITINKFSDLSGYLSTKRPGDIVSVALERNGKEMVLPVTLIKLETYEIETLGLEVKNLQKEELKKWESKNGVLVTRPLTRDMTLYNLSGSLITAINDQPIEDIDDVKSIMENRNPSTPVKITFIDENGATNTFIFR